jgi:hypothetical protein
LPRFNIFAKTRSIPVFPEENHIMSSAFQKRILIVMPACVSVLAFMAGSAPFPIVPLVCTFMVSVAIAGLFQFVWQFNYLYPKNLLVLPTLVFCWGGLPHVFQSWGKFYGNIAGFMMFLFMLIVLNTTYRELYAPAKKTPPQ